jgi:O-antigen/teichoic acid export membrane protein
VTTAPQDPAPDSAREQSVVVVRNVSTRYLAIAAEMVVGLAVLPFNVAHLGKAAYGLWMLTASITAYFSVLDLGYSGAIVKFVAKYRVKRDVKALNEILSTTFFLFVGFGALAYAVAIGLAFGLERLFHLSPADARIGRIVLLATSANVACGIAFSVFGGVINGFQRYDLNNVVGAASSVVAAAVNVAVLSLGYGLVALVLATTTVRLLTLWVYRANAYRVFPELRLRLGLFSRSRLKEVTTFSIYMALIDWANKLNYSVDALVIGAFFNTSAVAVWSIGQRLAETTQRLTNQINEVLFPAVVGHDTARELERLRSLFVVGTRLSIAMVVPIGGAVMLMARPLVYAWVGPQFDGSAIIVQLLVFTVIVRVATATSTTVLKGGGHHRLLAATNLGTSLVNLTLSLLLVRRFGLVGVALGTLLPVCLSSMLILFPAGCHRVALPMRRVAAEALWPALWPAAVMAAFVLLTAPLIGDTLIAVGAEMATAAVVYALTFLFFGVSAAERRVYFGNIMDSVNDFRLSSKAVSEGA